MEGEREGETLNSTEEPLVEPVRGEPARGEPARGEPSLRGEPARGEPSLRVEPARGEPARGEPARGEPSLSPDDLPTPLASVHTSPTRHPHPKSEVRYASSYPSLSSLEHLPPLLSYDEGDGFGRSPSLHGSGGLLSEQEQVCCAVSSTAYACVIFLASNMFQKK